MSDSPDFSALVNAVLIGELTLMLTIRRHDRYLLSKLRAIVNATDTIKEAVLNAPPDAPTFEKRSLCAKAAPPYLTARVAVNGALPALKILEKPWEGPTDRKRQTIVEYVVGLGAEGGDGARMPDDLFCELLEYVGKK